LFSHKVGDVLMMVIISYDVNTEDKAGRSRLRRIAKECQNHAQRVQNSVFESDLDYTTFLKMKDKLIKLIDQEHDSLRFYYLGNNWDHKIEHIGAKCGYNPEGVILV
jgi:CRISPR-associated protein Cas2